VLPRAEPASRSRTRGRRRFWQARLEATLLVSALVAIVSANRCLATSILFIGNSFTYGQGSPVRFYRADAVTDLNGTGIGGVPALFQAFALEAGLDYEVSLETQPGVGIDWHLAHRLERIGAKPWDLAILQGYSTLDKDKPGDPAVLIASAKQMAQSLRARNPRVELRLMATWPRADQIYLRLGAWFHKTLDDMTSDIRSGYDKAAAAANAKAVVPVGQAWMRAIHAGIADSNPYDGIDAGKIDLWATDNYHASTAGYYLEALALFGSITGRDPRTLGDGECAGFELGFSSDEVAALQRVAYEEMAAEGLLPDGPKPAGPREPARCASAKTVR
jgi:hypothetical protein